MIPQSTNSLFLSSRRVAVLALAVWLSPPALFADDTKTDLKAQLSLSPAEASVAALAVVPNGKVKSVKLIWAFDITTPGSENVTAVQVDALTGKIITANTAFSERSTPPAPMIVAQPAASVQTFTPQAPVQVAVNNQAPAVATPAVDVPQAAAAAPDAPAEQPRVQADINPNFDGVNLDGTKWKLTVTPDAAATDKGEKNFSDELVFASGKATSTAGGGHGFTPSDYSTVDEGRQVHWHAEQVSDKDGKTIWLGKIVDNKMSGTLIWYKPDESILHYTVRGEKE